MIKLTNLLKNPENQQNKPGKTKPSCRKMKAIYNLFFFPGDKSEKAVQYTVLNKMQTLIWLI